MPEPSAILFDYSNVAEVLIVILLGAIVGAFCFEMFKSDKK